MTHASLSAEFVDRLGARRDGHLHVCDSPLPSRTALLVIDMQNAFVDPAGALGVPTAIGIVPAINRLADTLRRSGCVIAWVRTTFAPIGRSRWDGYFERIAPGNDAEALRANFYPGAAGHAIWPALERESGDLIVDKDRFSAFVQGASVLEELLRSRGIANLIITGTLTNVCCESSMRDAMMRDFQCVLVSDACAARSDAEHLASLENAAQYFGDVMKTKEVLIRVASGAQSVA
ncbi:MAG: cysteine hydrolase [Pseudomonadota bacterium]